MDGYAVKVDELGKLIDDLGTAADRMADANKKLGGGGAFGSLGTADLGKAGVEFEEAWGYGIGRLGEAASGITERLKQAKQKYEQIEAEFGGELKKFGSMVMGDDDPTVPHAQRGDYPRVGRPSGEGPAGPGSFGDVLGDDGMVGGGVTGGVPGINDQAESEEPGADLGGGMVGGGVTGGVPGVNDLAGRKNPGVDPDGGMVGGGATGGITDILNGLDR
ncbi:hypothetical protein AB0C38_04580 [Amycolatopsis sp. NPDC048633]|uniref:hypothetical protein n=1 Tax=Amycolatopsis sp. NPDC048633 TaxID=3157095 RepID=UPI0033EE04E9